MAEPKKISNWLAAAKAVPSSPSSPNQLSLLATLCNDDISNDSALDSDPDSFVTVVRPRRKSRSPKKGEESLLPQGDDFPALKTPPKKEQPTCEAAKGRGKKEEVKRGVKDTTSNGQKSAAKKLGELPNEQSSLLSMDKNEGDEKKVPITEEGVTTSNNRIPRAPPPPEVTAEFDGLMSELLGGLRLQQTPKQGPSHHSVANPRTEGPAQEKVVLSPQFQRTLQGDPTGPLKDCPATPLSRALFPNSQTQPKPVVSVPKPSTPKSAKPRPPIPTTFVVPVSPVCTPTPPKGELSFFALPTKTPNPYSPRSVLDLSSPGGSPSSISPTNQTLPAQRSPYRPAMDSDPKVIRRTPDFLTPSKDVMTSSPFSYTMWAPPLTSAGLGRSSEPEGNVLRESPCNIVKEANPPKVSRLGAWLGKEKGGLLETESDFHRALFQGGFKQPMPFGQPEETGSDDDEAFCKICFERESNSAYLCGHVLCGDCAEYIRVHKKVCPFCSKPVETVLRMFA